MEKLEIVNQSFESDCNIKSLANRYNISTNSVYRWRSEFNVDKDNAFAGNCNPVMTAHEKQIASLQKQIRELELEKEILKKAMASFHHQTRKICFHKTSQKQYLSCRIDVQSIKGEQKWLP